LALAAAGAGARVYASDTDPIAIDATRINFKANKRVPARLVRARGVPASFPRADLIVANITAPILERLAPAFARKLRAGGVLVTSGFIKSTAPRVRRTLGKQGLELLETGGRMQLDTRDRKAVVIGVWRAFVHRKPARERS
jgi:ribosomal protein L11 methylase PrmA